MGVIGGASGAAARLDIGHLSTPNTPAGERVKYPEA